MRPWKWVEGKLRVALNEVLGGGECWREGDVRGKGRNLCEKKKAKPKSLVDHKANHPPSPQ